MYYLANMDDFLGLGQTAPTCPAGYLFSNGSCTPAAMLTAATPAPATPAPGAAAVTGSAAAGTQRGPSQYEPVTENTKCSATDCNCWYSKAVNNIEYYNTANKSTNEYQTYKTNFAARYNTYLKCCQAQGIAPTQLNINTPPPGVTFSAPGAGANAMNAGGSSLLSTANSLLSPGGAPVATAGGETSMMEKVGISVGAAILLGGLVLMLTGKKKSPMAALAGALPGGKALGSAGGNITIDVGGPVTKKTYTKRRSSKRRR